MMGDTLILFLCVRTNKIGKVPLEREHVRVGLAKFAQCLRQAEQVFAVRPARAARRCDLACDVDFVGRTEISLVLVRGDVDDSFVAAAVVEMHLGRQAQVAVLFAVIQVREFFRRHQIGHAVA